MTIKWLAIAGLKLLIGLVAAATLLSCFGRWAWLLDFLTFARQHLLVAAPMLAGMALALRCRRWAAVAVATAIVNVVMLLPAWSPSLGPATAATPSFTLRVVTLNVLLENHRSKAAVKFLRDSGADVIAVEEISSWWADRLVALRDIYPYMAPADGAADSSILIYSRYPIVSTTVLQPPPLGWASEQERPVRAVMAVGGREVAIYAVHPPTPRSLDQWQVRNHQLEWLAGTSLALDADRPRIVLGDFNTPPWSFLFADIKTVGQLHDAGGGSFRRPTRQPMLAAPFLAWLGAPVDHVLVSRDITVDRFAVGHSVYSDHLPVIADLRLETIQSSAASPAR